MYEEMGELYGEQAEAIVRAVHQFAYAIGAKDAAWRTVRLFRRMAKKKRPPGEEDIKKFQRSAEKFEREMWRAVGEYERLFHEEEKRRGKGSGFQPS